MINQSSSKQEVKLFKNGNSYAFRMSKKDRELLNADGNTQFEKIISADGTSVTFKKIETQHPNILETANKLYSKHADLMKRLENL